MRVRLNPRLLKHKLLPVPSLSSISFLPSLLWFQVLLVRPLRPQRGSISCFLRSSTKRHQDRKHSKVNGYDNGEKMFEKKPYGGPDSSHQNIIYVQIKLSPDMFAWATNQNSNSSSDGCFSLSCQFKFFSLSKFNSTCSCPLSRVSFEYFVYEVKSRWYRGAIMLNLTVREDLLASLLGFWSPHYLCYRNNSGGSQKTLNFVLSLQASFATNTPHILLNASKSDSFLRHHLKQNDPACQLWNLYEGRWTKSRRLFKRNLKKEGDHIAASWMFEQQNSTALLRYWPFPVFLNGWQL